MTTRVVSGCRDCKACTNSGIANAGRATGRAAAAVLTVGGSEFARGFTKNCRACGHKLSLHGHDYTAEPVRAMQPIQVVVQQPLPAAAPPGWYPDAADVRFVRWWDGYRWTGHVQPRV